MYTTSLSHSYYISFKITVNKAFKWLTLDSSQEVASAIIPTGCKGLFKIRHNRKYHVCYGLTLHIEIIKLDKCKMMLLQLLLVEQMIVEYLTKKKLVKLIRRCN